MMRVVSLCPSNTEVVGYLGKEEMLIAVDDYSDWPEMVKPLPRIGPDLAIDMDKVEAMKPDLVLASLSVPGMERNIEELEKRKLPHIILDPQSFNDIADNIKTVGKALGFETLGREKAESFLKEIEKYRMLSKKIRERPSLYWEWWPKPIFTPGGINWLSELSRLAGGYNIFETEDKANVQTDWEEVIRRNPDHICMVWVGVKTAKMNRAHITNRPHAHELTAVKTNNIHLLEENFFCRPSPRLLKGLEKLTSILHNTSSNVF